MKKNFGLRALPVVCFVATLALGCGSDDKVTTVSCEQSVNKVEAALTAYMNDINDNSKCQAFKAAANDLLDCPGITQAQKTEYENTVAGLTCQ